MADQARPPELATAVGGALHLPAVLEAVIRVLAATVTADVPPRLDAAGSQPLLEVEEAAKLLRVSRMTVTRMADEGRLPAVIIRRGRVQKTRRIPRAFVDRVVADACAGGQVDLEQYAAAWLAGHASAPSIPPVNEQRDC